MIGTNWFYKKWGIDEFPMDNLYKRLSNLESKIKEMEEKYNFLLLDLKRLEEENIETTNVLYEIMNSIEAVDSRIDIVAENSWEN